MGANWVKPSWPPELRADAWTGCILSKLAVSPRALDASLRTLEKYPSVSHPAWAQRLPVLRTGYLQCGGSAPTFDKRK